MNPDTMPSIELKPTSTLALPCRYYRVYTDLDTPCREENFGFVERDLLLPVAQTALILVDVWATHYIDSFLKRADGVMDNYIVPLLTAARKAGLTIIHAPSADVAELRGDGEWPATIPQIEQFKTEIWPPADFRSLYRSAQYSAFGREPEPRLSEELKRYKTELRIAPAVQPLPGETLIKSGQELHELLAERQILHLIYAGFATNWCIFLRDYGVIDMSRRGYNAILVRDATTGIEFHDTAAQQTATAMAIREMETKHAWSTTTSDLVNACQSIPQPQ